MGVGIVETGKGNFPRIGVQETGISVSLLVLVRAAVSIVDGLVHTICLANVVVRVVVLAFGMDVSMIVASFEVTWAVRVAVATEHPETQQIGGEAKAAHKKHNLGIADVGRVEEALDGLEDDGDAKAN